MIFILIGIVIIIYSFFNFKKGFSLYLCYKLMLVTNITLISTPGLPLLTLEMAMTLVFMFMFFVHGSKYQRAHTKFPFAIPFLIYGVVLLASSMFSMAGFGAEISNFIKQLSEKIILVWMAWQLIETKDDFKFIFKVVTVIILGSCIYGLIEYILQRNPLTEYEASLNSNKDKLIDFSYGADSYRGYRINSIFEHAIGAGMVWALYAVFVFIIIQKKYVTIGQIFIPFITAILCIPCILFTNSRSPLLFFAVSMVSIVNFKSKRFYPLLLSLLVGAAIAVPLLSDKIINVIKSFFSGDAANTVGGSNLEMRLDQFAAAFELMFQSPLFGLGPSFRDVIDNNLVDRLLGGESIWLQAVPQMGILGVVAYVVQVIYFIVIIPKRFKSRQIFFVSLAYWLTYTITSIPGFNHMLFFIFIFYFIKSSRVYGQMVKVGNVYGLYLRKGVIHYNVIRRRPVVIKEH